jgi:2-polyprenyl-6-methoxyphenol hydroxylase-like FAD-dependent oxidoreductase
MATQTYDIITVGGGLAGAALAKVMAEQGARVLVLETETQFKDRVRGEWIASWGVAEARALGIYDAIMAAGGHELRWWNSAVRGRRDLLTTTAPGVSSLSFYHPHMQEALLAAARHAGADVRRGARVQAITTNGRPTVIAHIEGHAREIPTRLVVGADGRNSTTRRWAGFAVHRDADQILVAGVLFDEMDISDDGAHTWRDFRSGRVALLFPQGHGRVRAYLCYLTHAEAPLSGDAAMPRFIEYCQQAGAPAQYYGKAKAVGPLATFRGADTWVAHPYNQGVALLGDAAATSDPTWGQGLSLTMRDVRVLRDYLVRNDNWQEAGHAYAEVHDRYYGVLHTYEAWQTHMLMTTGPEADARRAKALSLWREDPSRNPDIVHSGPDQTLDETARRRYFGEA